jgi:hypothetical protein
MFFFTVHRYKFIQVDSYSYQNVILENCAIIDFFGLGISISGFGKYVNWDNLVQLQKAEAEITEIF